MQEYNAEKFFILVMAALKQVYIVIRKKISKEIHRRSVSFFFRTLSTTVIGFSTSIYRAAYICLHKSLQIQSFIGPEKYPCVCKKIEHPPLLGLL